MLSKSVFFNPSATILRYQYRYLSLVSFDNKQITVAFSKESRVEDKVPQHERDQTQANTASFSTVFLRDACDLPGSVDYSTKQKLFTTAQVARGLEIYKAPSVIRKDGQNFLEVQWKHQDGSTHESSFSEKFLSKSCSLNGRMRGKHFPREKVFWTEKDLIQGMKLLNFDYYAYLEGNSTFQKALKALNKYGICFIHHIENPLQNPKTQVLTEANAFSWPVAKLAKKFGYIKSTFYGTLFDVKNDKNAKNIANTNLFLPLHMDLCYYESPPGLQLLHFIENSTLGGENVFADSFLAASRVKTNDPEAYEALKTMPITFHYKNNNEYYYYLRPLVVEEPYLKDPDTGEPLLKAVNYSPPFQGPFEMNITSNENTKLFDDFIRGMIAFEDAINDRANQYTVKSPENSCIIFDNRRVLHSRLGFTDCNGGDRWLMGCYVDGDSYRSKLRTNLS
ncbi:gamma-butyrobetaine dioxygenase [Metschnikowia aff. pulcherrima]|uniref:Gamma-butyrobetaine dioxygenase n=1 Tax=Metschnikowia aff. pulcherrima TaxID=2163413 RepID=A0A4V1ADT5_9ASCO|nr:gamma-butyrobetaine dioxygenase [Metschnikowia aff. pulcherrima]